MLLLAVLLALLQVGTWNLRWFPSGRAEHRAAPSVERANVEMVADQVSAGLSTNRTFLFFQEMRSAETTTNLLVALRARCPTLSLDSATSSFRDPDGRLAWQQTAIATDCPILLGGFREWPRRRPLQARGYTYLLADAGADGLVLAIGLHLKSNYGARDAKTASLNRRKREAAATALATLLPTNLTAASFATAVKSEVKLPPTPIRAVILAGDFNTDAFSAEFADERTLPILEEAGFFNTWRDAPPEARGSYPAHGGYSASTLDYILTRGLLPIGPPKLAPQRDVSDHCLVWLSLESEK